jgi:PAS domain-containing protein
MSPIINVLPDPTVVIDRKSRVIAWNRAMEDLTGVKAEAMRRNIRSKPAPGHTVYRLVACLRFFRGVRPAAGPIHRNPADDEETDHYGCHGPCGT